MWAINNGFSLNLLIPVLIPLRNRLTQVGVRFPVTYSSQCASIKRPILHLSCDIWALCTDVGCSLTTHMHSSFVFQTYLWHICAAPYFKKRLFSKNVHSVKDKSFWGSVQPYLFNTSKYFCNISQLIKQVPENNVMAHSHGMGKEQGQGHGTGPAQ